MKHITIFIGEKGAGKSFYLKRYSNTLDSANLKHLVKKEEYDTDRFMYNYLAPSILHKIVQSKQNLYVEDCLYLDRHRIYIRDYLALYGFKVCFIWVKPNIFKHILNFFKMKNSLKHIWDWLSRKRIFEQPSHKYLLFP